MPAFFSESGAGAAFARASSCKVPPAFASRKSCVEALPAVIAPQGVSNSFAFPENL